MLTERRLGSTFPAIHAVLARVGNRLPALIGATTGGLAPEANVRVTQLVFGPYTPFPVEFRIMGPDPVQLHSISEKALDIVRLSRTSDRPTATGAIVRPYFASFRIRID